MKMKAIEILGMWWDEWTITFGTTDGREGRVDSSIVADAMWKFGGSFEAYLGKALEHADAVNSKLLFDTFGWIIKDAIEKYVYPRLPEIIKSQD